MAREADSDDGANGYDSTSSDDAENLIMNLDRNIGLEDYNLPYQEISDE
jgi:hypothetical protein